MKVVLIYLDVKNKFLFVRESTSSYKQIILSWNNKLHVHPVL